LHVYKHGNADGLQNTTYYYIVYNGVQLSFNSVKGRWYHVPHIIVSVNAFLGY